MEQQKAITVRASGKCHPAVVHPIYGVIIKCSCPGSKNGSMALTARKVADGWEKVNCKN